MSISQMSVAGGTLVLITAILRLTLQRRLPRRTFLALWGVALARFLIPFSIPSPVSAYTVVSRAPALNETVKRLTAATTVAAYPVAGTANSAPLSSDAHAAASFPWLAAVWIIGALLCAAFFVFNHLRSRRVYAQSLPCRELPVLIDVNHNGPWRKIAVRVSDQIITPLTYGLFRPVILLPKRMKEESRDFVLAHELCHIRRMDVLWKSLFALCACVHWFNPTAWLMLFLVNRDMELSCDESVIRNRDGKTRKAYALTLIHMEEQRALANPIASGFSKNALEQRIKEVLRMKRGSIWIVLISVILVVSCAVVFATSALRGAQSERGTPDARSGDSANEAPYIADMLLNQDERLDELNLSFEDLMTAVLQDAFASGEYDYKRLTFDGLVPDTEFTRQDARERSISIADKLRNVAKEVPDAVNRPAAIRDKLLAEGLSEKYVRDHFLVNQCYFYVGKYVQQDKERKEAAESFGVARIQSAMWDAGMYRGDKEGIYDEETEAAVKRFQEDNGLPPDGYMTRALFSAIIEAGEAAKAEERAGGDSGEVSRYEIRMAFNVPDPDKAIRDFIGDAASGVRLVYSTRNDPSVKNKQEYDYANYMDDGKENRASFNWAECRVELVRAGATPLQYNDDPEWAEVISPSPKEGAYTRDEALSMALDALNAHLGIDRELLALQSVSVDSPEKKNAGMYLFWFNYQIDGILLSAGEYDGIVPFARVWVTDEGVRRMEATPLVVTDRIRVSVMTPGEVIDKNRLNADPSDAEMGYACVRENGGLTAVPIWTNLEDKRYDVVTGEPVGGAWG